MVQPLAVGDAETFLAARMFVAGSSHRAAEHAGDAAVEAWCESEDTPPAASLTGAPSRLIEDTADDAASLQALLVLDYIYAPGADAPGTPGAGCSYGVLEAYAANRAAWRRLLGGAGCVLPPRVLHDHVISRKLQ